MLQKREAKVGDRVKLTIGGYSGSEGGPGVPIQGELIFFDVGPDNNMNKGRPGELPYETVDPKRYYPWGNPTWP